MFNFHFTPTYPVSFYSNHNLGIFIDRSTWLGDRSGHTYESLGLKLEQVMVLHFQPAPPDTKAEMVMG